MLINTCKFTTFVLAGLYLATSAMAVSSDPNTLLSSLIKEHEAQKGVFAIPPKGPSIDRYFSKELAALSRKDVAVATKSGDLGAIDFDILFDTQDPQIKNLTISKAAIGGVLKHEGDEPIEGLATIEMTYQDNGKASRTGFQFGLNDAKQWVIDDIHYNDGSSLKSVLESAYPAKSSGAKASGSTKGPTVIETYVAHLGERDHVSSAGASLTTAAAILRQDRANFHKFNKKDAPDGNDQFLASAENRELLETLLAKGEIDQATEKAIINGTPTVVVTLEASGKTGEEYLTVMPN
ncbi:hypothetical protein BH09VER1_BH09VER1_48480 [soil metagenome]